MTTSLRGRVFALSLVVAGGALLTAGCSSETADTGAAAASSAAAAATSAASAAASTVDDAASSAGAVATSAMAAASSATSGGNGSYTLAEVQQHNTSGDCWTAIEGNVYDLTAWEDKHPGGAERIVSLCGTDGTAAFKAQHGSQEEPNETLGEYQIGTLS